MHILFLNTNKFDLIYIGINIPKSASMAFGELPTHSLRQNTIIDLAFLEKIEEREGREKVIEGDEKIGEETIERHGDATKEGTVHETTPREKRGRIGTFGTQQLEAVMGAEKAGEHGTETHRAQQKDAMATSAGRYRGETYGAQKEAITSAGEYRSDTYGAQHKNAIKPSAARYRGDTYGAHQMDPVTSTGKTGGYRGEIYYEEKKEAILKMETRESYEGNESSGMEGGDEVSSSSGKDKVFFFSFFLPLPHSLPSRPLLFLRRRKMEMS
jgi:hypothetical protein